MIASSRIHKVLLGLGLAVAMGLAPASVAFAAPAPPPGTKSTSAKEPKGSRVDINTASVAQLRALPGIGDVYAQRIVDGRPYSSKDQLYTKGILPRSVYEKVKNRLVAHRGKR